MAYFLLIKRFTILPHILLIVILYQCTACGGQQTSADAPPIQPGAYQIEAYLSQLHDQRVGLVVNHTSMIAEVHLVDTLLALGVQVSIIFVPEHGFKGTAYNGEEIKDGVYKDQIPIRSLHGTHKKPTGEDLSHLDILIFDIQDVGARFYTYLSTLHYVMEACAENDKKLITLDRPNPNGHYVDGPVLEPELSSFIGMHPVPIVYGMTIGEYARMINGEGWLSNAVKCRLMIVKNKNYTHNRYYKPPIPPSPNLPTQRSILLYPSLCLLEGTVMSEGRGTNLPFEQYGHPLYPSSYTYTPVSMTSSKYPKWQDQLCRGVNLSHLDVDTLYAEGRINLTYLKDSYHKIGSALNGSFFLENDFFDKLSGVRSLKKQIISGATESEIRKSWASGIARFLSIRKKYLLYP